VRDEVPERSASIGLSGTDSGSAVGGVAEKVAAVTAFLPSDQASFVNGIEVLVDGGLVAALRCR
jgi:NAD(P)-dependent dehydrogenase (short-subunit alcohol dehydrogenase family)